MRFIDEIFKPGTLLTLLMACTLLSCASTPMIDIQKTQGDLRGMVYDLDRQPVADATLSIEGSEARASTDIHGHFGVGPLSLGPLTVRLAKPGYEPLSWSFRFSDPSSVVYLQLASFDQLIDLATTSLEKQEWQAYREYLERARPLEPQSLTLVILEATGAEQNGDITGALRLLEAAITAIPRPIYTLEKMAGDLEAKLNHREAAVAHWNRALEVREDADLKGKVRRLTTGE